jgi:hypothetical protein
MDRALLDSESQRAIPLTIESEGYGNVKIDQFTHRVPNENGRGLAPPV